MWSCSAALWSAAPEALPSPAVEVRDSLISNNLRVGWVSCFPFVGILYRAPGFVLGVAEVLLGSFLRSGGRQRQIFYLHLLRQDGGRGTFSGLDASRGRSVALDDAAISKVWSILLDLVGGLDSGTGVHGRRRPEMRTTMMSSCVCLVVVVSLCSRVFDVKWGGTVLKF